MEYETASSPTIERTALTANANIAYLFQPDILLMEKFFNDRRGKARLEPEKRLMLAILEDAILSFQDNHAARHEKKKRLFDDVQRWIFEVSDDWVFSFEHICHVLELEPEYIRKGLRQWREKRFSKHSDTPLWKATKRAPELRF
jgi:hypothetical protein